VAGSKGLAGRPRPCAAR